MRRRALSAPLLVVLGLGAAACSDESTAGSAGPTTAVATTPAPTDTASPESTGAPATSATVAEVPEILRFTAPLVGGGTFDAAAVAGTPIALWFWAPG